MLQLFALARDAAGFVQFAEGLPVEVAVGVEAPVAGDEEGRAVGAEGADDLLHQRMVARLGALHAVEEPFPAEDIEGGLETLGGILEVGQAAALPVAFGKRRAADEAGGIPEREAGEGCFQFVPLPPELRSAFELADVGVILVRAGDDSLVAALPGVMLVDGNGVRVFRQKAVAAALAPGRGGEQPRERQDIAARLRHRRLKRGHELPGEVMRFARKDRDALEQHLRHDAEGTAEGGAVGIAPRVKTLFQWWQISKGKQQQRRAGIVAMKRQQPQSLQRAGEFPGGGFGESAILLNRAAQRLPIRFRYRERNAFGFQACAKLVERGAADEFRREIFRAGVLSSGHADSKPSRTSFINPGSSRRVRSGIVL